MWRTGQRMCTCIYDLTHTCGQVMCVCMCTVREPICIPLHIRLKLFLTEKTKRKRIHVVCIHPPYYINVVAEQVTRVTRNNL